MRRLKRGRNSGSSFRETDLSPTIHGTEKVDEPYSNSPFQPEGIAEQIEAMSEDAASATNGNTSKRTSILKAFIYLSLALIGLYLFAPLSATRVISPALAFALLFIFFGALLYIIGRICVRLFKLGYKKIAGLFMLAIVSIAAYAALSAYVISYDSLIDKVLADRLPSPTNAIYSASADGTNYEPVFCESERRVRIEEIAQSWLKLAIIAIEDERLPTRIEGPVDLIATIRAFVNTFKGRRQGGSTIQMQVAKLLMGKFRTHLSDKDTQTLLAIRIDQRFANDDELLALYCSLCSIDGDATGIAFAAADFFSVADLRNLSIAQAALLAGMLRSPSAYDPRRHTDDARDRRNLVLKKMYEQKFISEQQYGDALKEEMKVMGQLKPYELFVRAATIPPLRGEIKQ